jgi:hypothetical protein
MEMLEEHIFLWASDLFGDCFQQDSASAHRQTKLKIGCLNIALISSQEKNGHQVHLN